MSAAPLPSARVQFVDQNGYPLTGGSVTYYVPGTMAPKRTWSDLGMTAPNPATITLDNLGSCSVFGLGSYRQVVTDQNGNLVWDNETQTLPYASAAADALDSAVNTVLEQVGESAATDLSNVSASHFAAKIDFTQLTNAQLEGLGTALTGAGVTLPTNAVYAT